MKIYHKKNFAAGLLALAAGTGILLYSLWNGFSLYNLLWTGNFFWLGCKALEHSLSRELTHEDLVNERDERNRLLSMRSKSLTLSITQYAAGITGIILASIAKWVEYETPLTYIGLSLMLVWLFILFVQSSVYRYYDKRS